MNGTIFWHVFWKEYRLQRALWIAMLAIGLLYALLAVSLGISNQEKSTSLYLAAVSLPALYALGCGALLFAGEREAETYQFQRSLPAGAIPIFLGKIAFALASIVAMWAVTVGAATFWGDSFGRPAAGITGSWLRAVWATAGFFAIEALVWAVFFSLLLNRVLMAAILGVTAASTAATAVAARLSAHGSLEGYVDALPQRALIVLAVALVDVGLATRWFRDKRQRGTARLAGGPKGDSPIFADTKIGTVPYLQRPSRLAMLGRLVWQHWRQTRGTTIGVAALAVPLVATLIVWLLRAEQFQAWFLERHAGEIFSPGDRMFLFVTVVLALAFPPLLGLCAFMGDQQRNSYRYFADRGIPAKHIWLSRQLVTLAIPALLFLALMLALFGVAAALLPWPSASSLLRTTHFADLYAEAYAAGYLLVGVVGYGILGITVGQLCSMFFRSVIIGGLLSLVLNCVLTAWCGLMLFWQVPWFWSILPIPVALLLATRLRTPEWLLERKGLRSWLRPGLALLIAAAALLIGVPLHRVYSIPAVDTGFAPADVSRPLNAEDQKTLRLYEEACRNLTLKSGPIGTYYRAINTAIEASRRPVGNLPGRDSLPAKSNVTALARLLIDAATNNVEEGKLDVALERYLAAVRIAVFVHKCYPFPITQAEGAEARYCSAGDIEIGAYFAIATWSARPGQTTKRILAAGRELQKLTAELSPSNGLKLAAYRVERFLLSGKSAGDVVVNRQHVLLLNENGRRLTLDVPEPVARQSLGPPLTALWMQLPWERQRALRLLNLSVRRRLEDLVDVERRLRAGERVYQPSPRASDDECREMPYAIRTMINVPPVCFDPSIAFDKTLADYTRVLTARRAIQLILVLEAWKLEHHSLPKALDELVGHGLDTLPLDPYTGRPFLYAPEGLPARCGTLKPGQPFIWTAGPALYCSDPDAVGMLEVFSLNGTTYQPRSEYEIWQAGWPFPIP